MGNQQHGKIGQIRREQIIEAAVAIIDEKGMQHLSLSAIEQKAGMSRGQLTYYFPAKEEILLAVFDRLLLLMRQRAHADHEGDNPCTSTARGWERLKTFLSFLILHPPEASEFHSLQYTFLSQIAHREDFRKRLADLYEEWRSHMAGDVVDDLGKRGQEPTVSPRTFATLVQAILHGLSIQRVADPASYDRQEMLALCLDLLGRYLQPGVPETNNSLAPPGPATTPPRRPRGGSAKPDSTDSTKGDS